MSSRDRDCGNVGVITLLVISFEWRRSSFTESHRRFGVPQASAIVRARHGYRVIQASRPPQHNWSMPLLARLRHTDSRAPCPLSAATQKSFAHTEFFSDWPGTDLEFKSRRTTKFASELTPTPSGARSPAVWIRIRQGNRRSDSQASVRSRSRVDPAEAGRPPWTV